MEELYLITDIYQELDVINTLSKLASFGIGNDAGVELVYFTDIFDIIEEKCRKIREIAEKLEIKQVGKDTNGI